MEPTESIQLAGEHWYGNPPPSGKVLRCHVPNQQSKRDRPFRSARISNGVR